MTQTRQPFQQRKIILPGTTIGGEVGTFSADFVLRSRSANPQAQQLSGVVDTGASYTVIPESILDELGIEREESLTFELADGSSRELFIGRAEMELMGRTRDIYVIFGDDGGPVLLGAMALEVFALAADARNRRLIPAQLTI